MHWIQKEILLPQKPRGFHKITKIIETNLEDLKFFEVGLAHIFICHTSASITINENVSPDVWLDLENHFNNMVPENCEYYTHVLEGSDDMPAHIKSSIIGNSILIPITDGKFNLGTWQGIFLCEHRNNVGPRKLIITLNGKLKDK